METLHERIRKIRKRIWSKATKEQRKYLEIDDMYGSPASFWSTVLTYGLCTKEEYKLARQYYKDIWNYRGD